ncbi:D-alanyl-lipoteichoic acid biosynthesis protein DltD [Fructobacillus sp. CRL 2054]|uniref:D-alanyl-lipoteichoic acid biosynthesis protein DltD n=1 Tax=Fructobacillus sp. CRL 2054 TaxID=2763007 RepID=UPI0023787A15|nr:D-alanyl-lipoteichoic acid biosynthesis protein DltD [Fructobacillus sp. CRL 2054]MDD9138977.1 D-alanyl-lipoteichoic acid biosynthesis protein DltD [Fructobacillus sp. CRL 2054]
MSNKKKLWQIFGPVLAAFVLLACVFLLPFPLTHYSQNDLRESSVSFSSQIVKGEAVKNAAFSDKKVNYVPFFGSSELSRIDSLHPSVLAEKYKRNYQPFMLGKAGSDSLVHFLNMQEMQGTLKTKKAVYVVSPQWFTKTGSDAGFNLFYSPLQTVDWLRNIGHNQPSETDQFVASQLLEKSVVKNNAYYHRLLTKVSKGEKLSTANLSTLDIKHQILSRQDALFSRCESSSNYKSRVLPAAKSLPKIYSKNALDRLGYEEGQKGTTNNDFHIKNSFYTTRVMPEKKALKGAQKDYDYTKSVEYAYFQSVLDNFAKNHTDVMFVITPVNQRWAKYTGLNNDMYQESVQKIKYQLQSQGFNNIADLSKDGGKDYFMQDTIHVGWRGWLELDQYLNPFLSSDSSQTNYQINNRFLSKDWQNLKPSKQSLSSFK